MKTWKDTGSRPANFCAKQNRRRAQETLPLFGPDEVAVQKPAFIPSPIEVIAARTAKGGWTKETLAKWGVSWPPPHGWRRDLEQLYAQQQVPEPNDD